MAAQGLLLPISLLIQNLQDVANLLKKFAGSNVLENSLGGKKIDAELTRVLHTLAQIELKAKNAFKTDADFSSLEREVNRVELSIERILGHVKDLKFDELKIPDSAKDQLAELNAQIQALKNNFNTFKASKKDLLLANVDFTGNIAKAFSKGEATSILSKTYDDMYKAIDEGVKRINTRLIGAKAEFLLNSLLVTLNTAGKANFSAFGALSFVEEAFKKVENAGKMSKQQLLLSEYMNLNEQTGLFDSWKRGAIGMNGFYKRLAEEFKLDLSQLELIRKNVQEAAKEANRTAAEEWQKIANDHTEGAKVFGNGLSYADFKQSADTYAGQVKTRDASLGTVDTVLQLADAAAAAYRQLMLVLQEVASALTTLDAALRAPTSSLESLQEAIRGAITSTPQLGAAFDQAAQEIYNLRQAAEVGRQQLAQLDLTMSKLLGVSNFVNRYVGIYAIVRKVSTAIKNAFLNIKDLDKNITNIAVVTNMSQEDLWGKIGEYTQMAQQYGVATKDVYTVSQLFYQLGLQTAQVMSLTTETLKMAKISGMGYEQAANAMTVAIRAFRIEMTDAQLVTDVYSALAAKFAVSSAEIANAMEKTASSAANVGMSLESTSAFISVMTQTTRESAQNIGSALKSIISRYGEMKASPTSLLNVDGEDVAFNKVDTALKSIGISIKDASGQFRDFDDVIMELAQKWDTLDNNTQRYIATVMAGNRQQSRFIALVSNYDELNRAMETANNAENASIVQVAKTMDSLESKAQQLKNAFSQVYLDLHIEDGLKNAYDWLTRIMKTIGKLGVLNGVLPTLANLIGVGTGTKTIVNTAKDLVMQHRRDIEKKINLNDSEALRKADELNAKLSLEITKQVTIQANTALLEALLNVAQTGSLASAASLITMLKSADTTGTLTSSVAKGMLFDAQKEGKFNTAESRAEFLEGMGIKLDSKDYASADALLLTFNTLAGLALQLGTALSNLLGAAEGATGADELKTSAAEGAAAADQAKTTAATGSTTSDAQKAAAALEAANAELLAALEAYNAALADLKKAQDAVNAGNTDLEAALRVADAKLLEATDTLNAANANLVEAQASYDAAMADEQEAGASGTGGTSVPGGMVPGGGLPSDTGDKKFWSWNGNTTGMKVAGLATGVARLAGTAIAAAGAAHEDKSTDNIESSKILTGLGNGLSMAGTGASMGMAFGPWGAAIGAIGGFLLGGLGAIIDGAEMTLAERINLKKEEVKKAADESLKKNAEVTDLSTSIDNLKKLKKTMYNSADDMQAYKDAMSALGDQYPTLISAYDEAGNAIIDLGSAEELLASTRLAGASAARKAAIEEAELAVLEREALQKAKDAAQTVDTSGTRTRWEASGGSYKQDTDTAWTVYNSKGVPIDILGTRTNHSMSVNGHGANVTDTVYDYLGRIATAYADIKAHPENYPDLTLSSESIELITIDEARAIAQFLSDNWSETVEVGHKRGSATWTTTELAPNIWTDFLEQFEDGTSESTFTYDVSLLDDVISEHSDLFNGASSAAEYLVGEGLWDENTELNKEEVNRALVHIESKLNAYDKKIAKLRTKAGYALGLERLFSTAEISPELSTEELTELEGNSIYSSLFTSVLEQHLPSEYTDLVDWSKNGKKSFSREASLLGEEFINWYNSLSDAEQTAIESLDFTQYIDVDSMMTSIGLSKEENKEIYEAFSKQFAEKNKTNRERILKTVYNYDDNGNLLWTLNDDMTGLAKFTDSKGNNLAQNIAYRFGEYEDKPAQILSKYSDYFTTLLLDINNLADQGYTELASRRLTALDGLSLAIADIDDDQVLNDLFNTITSIDFSSFSSIETAIKAVNEYGKNQNVDVSGILSLLLDAEGTLVYNVNTLAQELTTKVTSAAKDIDSILTTNKSGLTLDKAIESFNKLSASFSEIDSFDDVFTYDAALGKYVYTTNGLRNAIAAKETELATSAELLSETAKIYTDKILPFTQHYQEEKLPDNKIYANADEIMQTLDTFGMSDTLLPYYQEAANKFMAIADTDKKYGKKTWENYIAYLEEQVKTNSDNAEAALKLLDEYKANKKNQLYQAIDWGKLDLGTDYSGTNKMLIEQLGQELGMMEEVEDEVTKEKIWQWKEGIDGTWEEVINLYLDATYTDENAKQAAKAAIKGQMAQNKSSQISTAITEVLNGTGLVLSEATLALVLNRADLTIADGVVSAGDNFVNTALDLYSIYSSNLLTLADKNTVYTNILSKSFELSNLLITAFSSASSMDLTTLSDTFTKFGLNLDLWYNAKTLSWQLGLEAAMRTDAFGKTTITDWDKFLDLTGIRDQLTDEVLGSFEYQNAYSSYVDGIITLDTQMTELIKKNYDNAFSSITEWKPVNVSKLAKNEKLVKKLTANNAATIEGGKLVVENAVEYAKNATELFAALSAQDSGWLYENTGWTKADIAKNWKNAQTVITEVLDTWTSISENISSLSTDNISTLIEKGNFNLGDLTSKSFIKIGDTYTLILSDYADYLAQLIAGVASYSKVTDNAAKKKIDDAYHKAQLAIINKVSGLEWNKILDGTATSAENDAFVSGLLTSLASLGMSLSTYYDASGALDVTSLMNALRSLNTEVTNAIADSIALNVAETRDTMLTELSSNAELLTKGTNNQADITKFVLRYNKLTGGSATADELFEYDDALQSYTLTTAAFIEYSRLQKEQLLKMGMSNEYITQYLKDLAQQLAGQEMDITGFLTGTDLSANGHAASVLVDQLVKWKAILGEKLTETALNDIMKDLTLGGENAVKRLKELKGEANVTADDITTVYRAQVTRLQDAASQLAEASIGSVITGDLVNIFKSLGEEAGFKVKDLGDGTAVVEAIGNMVDAYSKIYQQMAQSADATTAELNAAFALVLTASEQGDIDAIDAMSNAMGMTYDALGEILAKSGTKLEDWLADEANSDIYERIGAGKIRITDFKAFAKLLGWTPGSEEYTAAFKAYNDSLIELDNKTAKDITEEIKAVSEAKTGDKVNITYLTEAIAGGETAINVALKNMGATVTDGILEIENGARVGEIVATLANLAKSNGLLITAELAELADAVEDFIDSIVAAIKGGISGSLKNTEANELKDWAKAYAGIEDLDFTRTAEGLQLSEQSAIALYAALKKVDSVKASLVFDELNDSLKKNNDNFSSVSALMGHIRKISEGIYSADDKVSKARLQQYEAELSVAKEILAVRSTQEDDSFNFMSNKIPAALNNPLNYAKNLTLAFQTFRDAFKIKKKGKTGFMDYQDWYNIVNEFNNMAAVTGQEIKLGSFTLKGDLESASAAILAGAESLTTVDTGELKVNLASVGVGIEAGAGALGEGVNKGIEGVAKAQVKALDGIIAMLELIVAMEKLGDIDTDENGIDLSDLFEVTYDENGNKQVNYDKFSKDYEAWVNDIKDKINKDSKNYNKDLANAVNGIKIDGTALVDILDWTPAQMASSANKSVALAYAAVLDAFNKAALSGNYDLDNIQLSVLQVLAESGFDDTVTLDIGDMTYVISAGTMTIIDWTDVDTSKVVKDLAEEKKTSEEEARKQLTAWIQAYGKGELTEETELHYVLRMKKKVTMEGDKVTSVTAGGKTYYAETSNKATMDAAMNAAVLEDFGYAVTEKDILAAVDGGTATVTVKTKVGDVDIDVESNNGQVRLVGPHGKYKNQAEFLEKEWDYVARDHGWIDQGGENARHYDSKEKWQWGEYHVATQVTPKFSYEVTGQDAKEVNPSKDTGLRTKLTDLVTGGRQAMLDLIDKATDHGDGTYTVNLGDGYKFTFTGGTDPTSALEQAIGEQLGINVGLSNTISTAIANAFANKDVKDSVSEAIKTGMQNAFGGVEGETQEIPIPSITLKPNEINIDTSNINDQLNTLDLAIKDLTAIISKYDDSTADKTILVNALTALIVAYDDSEADTTTLANAIVGAITSYDDSSADTTKLVSALTAIISNYNDTSADKSTLVNALTAFIIAYNDKGADKSKLVNALTAYISKYNDENATKPTLEDLTQFINEINTNGADAALAAWRAQQESQALVIPVELGNDRRPSRQPGEAPKWYGNDETDTMIYAREFSDWAGELALHIYLTGEEGNSYGTDFEYIPGYGQSYEGVNLPEGWTLGDNGRLYTNNIPTTNYEHEAEDGGWEFVTPEGETVTLTGEIEELNTEAVDGEAVELAGNITPETNDELEIEDIELDALIEADTKTADEQVEALKESVEEGAIAPIDGDTKSGEAKLSDFLEDIAGTSAAVTINADATNAYEVLRTLKNNISNTKGTVTINAQKGSDAKGNVALAGGTARAGGQSTLMGELGPELVVSNGRYFVVGQGGAEFVDLAPDAIVFNHKQTASLLSNGKAGRGKPITNEDKAISWAKGNANGGPAMASASAALAALKQLRAQWDALSRLSTKDLLGGGGGGGGGGNKSAAYIKELEKWYNWLQKIARLEKDINYEESKRNRISSEWNANGHEYFLSLLNSLHALQEQAKTQNDLLKSQKDWFDKRREEMNAKSNPFTALYTFDEHGQIQYKEGAMKKINEIVGTNNEGKPNMTPEEQYKAIIAMNPEFAKFMKYDSSGKEIEFDEKTGKPKDEAAYAAAVQAFMDKMDKDKAEMLDGYDSIEELYKTLQDSLQKQNEIMKEMRDNLKDLEQKIYDTIVDIRLRAIDDFLDTRDALEKSNSKLLEGLNNALTKEQEKFLRDENDKDLRQKRDQLNILRRNGGSGTEISNLEKEIQDLEQTAYFDEQLKLIDELLEAQNKELEKMDLLIDLMTETLAFEQKYGLLWEEVTAKMQESPKEIANFIATNNSEYWDKSPITREEEMLKLLFSSEQWTDFRDTGMHTLQESIDAIKAQLEQRENNNSDAGNDLNNDDNNSNNDDDGNGDNEQPQLPQLPQLPLHGTYYRWKYNSKEYKTELAAKDQKSTDYKATINAYNTAKAAGQNDTANELYASALQIQARAIEKVKHEYKAGGMNDYTGLAMMHGTKKKPEAVLNAEQTGILRNKILGGGKKSLLNLLGTLQDALSNTADSTTYSTINRGSGDVTFDGTEVNMNFNEVSNDYDARRAGEEAMKEMLRVARKTSVNALNRGR